jgi:hypothetical protein
LTSDGGDITAEHAARRLRGRVRDWGASPYPLGRRLVRGFWRLLGSRPQKSSRARFATIGGRRFKRIHFGDSWIASKVERHLESFADVALFPPLIARYESEIWVDYVEGSRPRGDDPRFVELLADFFAVLYRRAPRRMRLAETGAPARLDRDLRFLGSVGVVSETLAAELRRTAERLAPDEVWVGFDYLDPVLKNFVVVSGSGRLCAVDVEGLCGDEMLGTGVARALARWAEPHREALLARVLRDGTPDFGRYFGYVELSFAAAYTALMVLERKWKFVEPARLELFRPA